MTRSVFGACFVWLAAALALAQTGPPAPQPTALPVGSATVAEVKGEVTLRSPQGAPLSAQRGQAVPAESTIETAKGTVLLDLQDGSQVLVRARSRVVLKSPAESKGFYLEMLLGKIVAKVRKRLGGEPAFRMGTPTAVITVRGTHFEVEVTKKNTTFVYVYDGLVEVLGMRPSPPVMLRPGFSTRVERDQAPQQPRQLLQPGGPGLERENEGPYRPGGREPGDAGQTSQPRTSGEKPD